VRVLIVIVVIVVIFGIAGVLVGPMAYHYVQQNMDDSAATDVRLEAPTRGDIIELVQAPGEVEPKRNVELSARISARIIELPYEEGDMVEEDDVLIRLDSTDYDAALRGALARRAGDAASIEVSKARLSSRRASLESQHITLTQLKLTHQRNVEQLKTKDIAQATVDESATRVRELEASIKSQETSTEPTSASSTCATSNIVLRSAISMITVPALFMVPVITSSPTSALSLVTIPAIGARITV